jgi:hypothetical protein
MTVISEAQQEPIVKLPVIEVSGLHKETVVSAEPDVVHPTETLVPSLSDDAIAKEEVTDDLLVDDMTIPSTSIKESLKITEQPEPNGSDKVVVQNQIIDMILLPLTFDYNRKLSST